MRVIPSRKRVTHYFKRLHGLHKEAVRRTYKSIHAILVQLLLTLRKGFNLLLVLGDEIDHYELSRSEFHLVHTLTSVHVEKVLSLNGSQPPTWDALGQGGKRLFHKWYRWFRSWFSRIGDRSHRGRYQSGQCSAHRRWPPRTWNFSSFIIEPLECEVSLSFCFYF